jgi:flap endonuclease-1
MGLTLGKIITKKQIEFNSLKNKKIAIDASQMLYQFIASIRQADGTLLQDSKGNITSHLMGLSTRIPNLINKDLKLAFIFDGTPPSLKLEEQSKRREIKEKAKEKFEEAKEQGDEESMLKYSKQSASINHQIIEESKELIKAFGLPIIQAPSEAEAQCSFMAENKDVDYVGSTDYDSLLYLAPKLIRNLTVSQKRKLPSGQYIKTNPEIIELNQVLEELEITQDQLLIMAILTGTDYNPKGIHRIGPKKALKLVKEHSNYEDIFSKFETDFDWKEIYAVFKSMPIIKDYQLKWSSPDKNKIREILIDNHEFSEERINKMLSNLKEEKNFSLSKWT